jgi:hypothetical protein
MPDAVPDDPRILGDTVVWRRIPTSEPNRWYVPDENSGDLRPSSQAFMDNRNGPFSVYIADECGGVDVVLADHEGFALASLTVEFLRSLGLGIVRDEEHGGPGHCLVKGDKTKSISVRLAKASKWVVRPPQS